MPTETDLLRVLCVDCRLAGGDERLAVVRAATAGEAMDVIRRLPIDLLLTTNVADSGPVWPLLSRVRRVRPKLPWWLVARGIGAEDEVLARTLGVTRVLAEFPTAADLIAACRRPRRAGLPARAPPRTAAAAAG